MKKESLYKIRKQARKDFEKEHGAFSNEQWQDAEETLECIAKILVDMYFKETKKG